MIHPVHFVSWFALLLVICEMKDVYYSRCYNDTSVSGGTICLSTNTSVQLSWSDATAACNNIGLTLVDVTSGVGSNILNTFRAESGSLLSKTSNWINVYSTVASSDFIWINNAPLAPGFDVRNQLNDGAPPAKRFALIRGDSPITNQPIYYAASCNTIASHICQFAGTGVCAGGLVRNSTCYIKYNEPLTWFDASNSCLQKGGSLAIFADLAIPYNDDNLTAWLSLTAYSSYWIGLIIPWWTRTGGGNLQYSNWQSGYPGPAPSAGQTCVLINSSSNAWISYDCGTPLRFVCQTIQSGSIVYSSAPTLTPTTLSSPSADGSSSSSTNSTQPSTSTSLSTGGAIGIAIAALVVVVLVVIIIVYCVKRHRRTADERSVTELPDIPVSIYDEANDGEYDEIPATPDTKYESLSEAKEAVPRIYEKMDAPMSISVHEPMYDKDGYLILTPSHTNDNH